ncbi:hypothetical protein VTG60DRAFT_1827 [Thermothelomyces hinnuleus]
MHVASELPAGGLIALQKIEFVSHPCALRPPSLTEQHADICEQLYDGTHWPTPLQTKIPPYRHLQ